MTEAFPGYCTIAEAAERTSFTPQYIRLCIRQGRIKSRLVPMAEGSLVMQHIIPDAEVERFKAEAPHKSRRGDKRNKFIIYLSSKEYGPVKKVIADAGYPEVAAAIRPANKLKGYKSE